MMFRSNRPCQNLLRLLSFLLLGGISFHSCGSGGGCGVVTVAAASSLLSIPQYDRNNATKRKAAILAVAKQISNQPRFLIIDKVKYPLPPGPLPLDGSLAQQIVLQEFGAILQYGNPNLDTIAKEATVSNTTSLNNYLSYYQRLNTKKLMPVPLTALDFGDVAFGQDRLTIKGFFLRRVTKSITTTIPLSSTQLKSRCGASSLNALIQSKSLYVEDLSFASKFNDPKQPKKYVPSVRGYFCVNTKKQFLPIAIHILDTKLVYTPYDSTNEWKLAKMALNAAGINAQGWNHLVQSHVTMEPIYVELLRSMSPSHPLYVLMAHHFVQVFANEILALQVLWPIGSTHDRTFGWGVTGSVRYVYNASRSFDFTKGFFITRIQSNGLGNIPNGKLFTDSKNIYNAIQSFVQDFVTLYYSPPAKSTTGAALDKAVAADIELQNWFARASKFVPGFPSKVRTAKGLVGVLSNLIFRTSVLHHAMNSDVFWHIISFPYSLPSLFAPLPKKKGVSVNLASYVIPKALFPPLTTQAADFLRPIGPGVAILSSYDSLAFKTTAKAAITKYETSLKQIESKIAAREKTNKRPYIALKPSRLPHYVWI